MRGAGRPLAALLRSLCLGAGGEGPGCALSPLSRGVGGETLRANPGAGGGHSKTLGTSLGILIVLIIIIKESPRVSLGQVQMRPCR